MWVRNNAEYFFFCPLNLCRSIPRLASHSNKAGSEGNVNAYASERLSSEHLDWSFWSLTPLLLVKREHPWCSVYKLLIWQWRTMGVLSWLRVLSVLYRRRYPWVSLSETACFVYLVLWRTQSIQLLVFFFTVCGEFFGWCFKTAVKFSITWFFSCFMLRCLLPFSDQGLELEDVLMASTSVCQRSSPIR